MTSEAIYDVVVVGGGGSGLAAAIEARAVGRDVVLLEKNLQLGGSTAWSIGSVTASQTPHQARKGIVDNPADHWRDMAGFNGELEARDNADLRRLLADEMPETFRWLLNHGVRFYGPMPEPPHSKPRMHNVLPNSRAFITHLSKAARRAGVKIECGTRATALVAENGRIVGIDCATASGPRRLRARGGVVLAAGYFTSDPESSAGATTVGRSRAAPSCTARWTPWKTRGGCLRVSTGNARFTPRFRLVPCARGPSCSTRFPRWSSAKTALSWARRNC